MILYTDRLLCLTEDVQQVVVTQEEEPGEEQPFGLQVRIQTRLHVLELPVGRLEVLK